MTDNKINDYYRRGQRFTVACDGSEALRRQHQIPAAVAEEDSNSSHLSEELLTAIAVLKSTRNHFTDQTWRVFFLADLLRLFLVESSCRVEDD